MDLEKDFEARGGLAWSQLWMPMTSDQRGKKERNTGYGLRKKK